MQYSAKTTTQTIMNNRFDPLKTEDTGNEIKTDNQLRNREKKLRRLKTKPQTPENDQKIKNLQVEINEYKHQRDHEHQRDKKIPKKSPKVSLKKQKRQRTKESEEFLNAAYLESQTPAYKKKKEAHRRQSEECERLKWEARERARMEYEKRKREKEEREKKEREDRARKYHLRELINALKYRDAPEDMLSLAKNYDHKGYLKLSRKYHPDKNEKCGEDEYNKEVTEIFKLLGCIKDYYEPIECKSDETWVK